MPTDSRLFGRYTISEKDLIHAKSLDITFSIHIGRGVFSDVYLVRYKSEKAVLKVTHRDKCSTHTLNSELIVSKILKDKRHENVTQFLDVLDNCDKTQIWFLMNWIEGEDMNQILRRRKTPFPETVAKDYFRQLVAGLQYLHSVGIVHRDIKPSNIIIGRIEDRDVIKYIDFGFAKAVQSKDDKAICDSHKGSPVYMAPELMADKYKAYDAFKTDIYSLAIVLYQMLFHDLPFGSADLAIDNKETNAMMLKLKENLIIKYPDTITVDESVKDLIENMIREDSQIRFGINEVLNSNWLSK